MVAFPSALKVPSRPQLSSYHVAPCGHPPPLQPPAPAGSETTTTVAAAEALAAAFQGHLRPSLWQRHSWARNPAGAIQDQRSLDLKLGRNSAVVVSAPDYQSLLLNSSSHHPTFPTADSTGSRSKTGSCIGLPTDITVGVFRRACTSYDLQVGLGKSCFFN